MLLTRKVYLQFITVLSVALLLASSAAGALEVGGPRDCDANAVIRCGSLTTAELKRDYANSAYAKKVYRSFGISSSEIESIGNTAKAGKVTKRGNVYVEGREKPVATDAMTAGRMDIPGSAPVTIDGITYYKRAPSVSFQQASLPAFVVMKDGKFQYAIIASCANPVSATPVIKEQTRPVPEEKEQPSAQPVPEQPPAPAQPVQTQAQAQEQTQTQQQSQSQHVTVNQTTAAPPPPQVVERVIEKPAPVASKGELPNVGIAGAGSAFLLSSLLGTIGFRRWMVKQ